MMESNEKTEKPSLKNNLKDLSMFASGHRYQHPAREAGGTGSMDRIKRF